jgi:hypothetical protein
MLKQAMVEEALGLANEDPATPGSPPKKNLRKKKLAHRESHVAVSPNKQAQKLFNKRRPHSGKANFGRSPNRAVAPRSRGLRSSHIHKDEGIKTEILDEITCWTVAYIRVPAWSDDWVLLDNGASPEIASQRMAADHERGSCIVGLEIRGKTRVNAEPAASAAGETEAVMFQVQLRRHEDEDGAAGILTDGGGGGGSGAPKGDTVAHPKMGSSTARAATLAHARQFADDCFNEADRNGDGTLSKSEIRTFDYCYNVDLCLLWYPRMCSC